MDITKCHGVGCPIRENCFRYTAKADEYQSYFAESPIKDGKCDYFWLPRVHQQHIKESNYQINKKDKNGH